MATYWMQGIATPFQPWSTIVTNYLLALKDFALTGSQESLKATINTDQGRPYAVAKSAGDGLDAVVLKQRAEGYAEQRKVPAQARFLTTAVDVQKARFVVEVHAWGANKERWVVDRFNLTKSDRIGEDGERMKVQPFSYAEDWNCLDKLLEDEFEVEGTGVKVQSRMIVCDSGGGHDEETGTSSTANSYVYALRLRRLQKIARFSLIKGASTRSAARIAEGKAEVGKIKVPLRIINTTLLKDETNESLARTEAGAGYIHLPEWVGEWYFKELSAEVRTVTGWTKRRKADNNEAFDLMGYNAVAYSLCGCDKINWDNPPDWCAKPLGEQIPEKATVQRESNTNYLEYLRKRGKRLNGE
jgi:phage terminase large subunit GpA-like protein